MELCILGSGTAIPHRERGASGYALRSSAGRALVLECGPGSTRRWPLFDLSFSTIDGIFVTHRHLDHVGDLGPALFARALLADSNPLVLGGPCGHRAHVAALTTLHASSLGEQAPYDVLELEDRARVQVGPFAISAREVQHPPPALGLRIEAEGRTFAFSGDSGPCDALLELCASVDVALLECSYPAHRETRSHLTTQTAACIALEAKVRTLVLTHFYPECDAIDLEAEVRAAGYTGALVLARDGARIEV